MTRSKLSGEEEEGVGSIPSLENLLMLLSRCGRLEYPAAERVFVCKTCARQFSSFQALGGHRASHREDKTKTKTKTKSHDQPAVMREELSRTVVEEEEKAACAKRVLLLDMNLPRRDKPRSSLARNKAVAWARQVCR